MSRLTAPVSLPMPSGMPDANTLVAARFLRNLMAALPDTIHTVLTDHGIQFTTRTRDMYAFHHLFDRVCHEHGLDHRLHQAQPSLDQWPSRTDEPYARKRPP